jgi:hypothetical protein
VKARHVVALISAMLLIGLYWRFMAWGVGMGCAFANAQNCGLRLDDFFDPETTWWTLSVALVSGLLVIYALWGARKGKTHEQD